MAAVALCTLINVMDGLEIFASSYTAADIARQFGLDAVTTGIFLGASPAGMVFGAAFLSRLGDSRGRRWVALVCLSIVSAGVLMTLLATGTAAILAGRVVTGIGVGALMATINTVVAEVTVPRWRDFCIAVQAAGFPAGAVLGGLVVHWLGSEQWRHVFAVGLGLALLMLLLSALWFPEPVLAADARDDGSASRRPGVPPRAAGLDNGTFGRAGLCISASFFCIMFAFFFLNSWLPKLLGDALGSNASGIHAGIFIGVGGVIGDLIFAALVTRWASTVVVAAFCCITTLLIAALAIASLHGDPAAVPVLALLVGIFLYGAMAGHYAIVPKVYPSHSRVGGTGRSLAIGRVGAASGPLVGGLLLQLGTNLQTLLVVMSLPLLLCSLLAVFLNGLIPRDNA